MKKNQEASQVPALKDGLDSNKLDRATALARGVVGSIPGIGPLLAEVIGVVIPRQRLDRIVDVLAVLEQRLQKTEYRIEEILATEERIDLLEEGMFQAIRAVHKSRREHLASLLASSLTKEDLDYAQKQRLFQIFEQMNDAEIIILQSYGLLRPAADNFIEKHQDVLWGPSATLGSSEEEIDKDAVHKSFRQNLASLGLLKPRFKKARRGELPEFDDRTGMIKASDYELAPLGRVMLRYLDLEVDY